MRKVIGNILELTGKEYANKQITFALTSDYMLLSNLQISAIVIATTEENSAFEALLYETETSNTPLKYTLTFASEITQSFNIYIPNGENEIDISKCLQPYKSKKLLDFTKIADGNVQTDEYLATCIDVYFLKKQADRDTRAIAEKFTTYLDINSQNPNLLNYKEFDALDAALGASVLKQIEEQSA